LVAGRRVFSCVVAHGWLKTTHYKITLYLSID
jgi:hypothetical protein